MLVSGGDARLHRRMKAIVEVRGLTIQRGDKKILDGIDWTVGPGENWVILGPNGSGKTSLLSALTAYLTPSDGTLTVCGETFGAYDWRELRKKIGLVSSALLQRIEESQTALDVACSGKLAILNNYSALRATDRRHGLTLLRQLGCAYLADRLWLYLSQGERQRVLIARALIARLKLLILDEPCSGLDPVAREGFLRFLAKLAGHRHCPALVLVTHHVEEIIPAFTHVLLLKGGRVESAGPVKTTLTSARLTKVFKAPLTLRHRQGRYSLAVRPRPTP